MKEILKKMKKVFRHDGTTQMFNSVSNGNIIGNNFSNSGGVTINGKKVRIPNGKNITITNGKIFVDGKELDTEEVRDEKIINLTIEGNVGNITADSIETITAEKVGPVDCHNVVVNGDIEGDIDCHNITVTGNVKGDIDGHNVTVGGRRL